MDLVRARLGNLIEYGPASAAKLSAKVCGLDIHLFDGVRVGYSVSRTSDGDVVVFDTINHKVVAAWALSIHGKSECAVLVDRVRDALI